MALITALMRQAEDRRALEAAAPPHGIEWVDDWRALDRRVRARPAAAAVAELHAEPRKDGGLRVLRFARRYPRTPLIVWGELDARELLRMGRAGASEVVLGEDVEDADRLREVVTAALRDGCAAQVACRLSGRIPDEAFGLVKYAAERIARPLRVPDLAEHIGVSVSTVERRCEDWGIPGPGRLLLWLRVLQALYWLAEPGRSAESVARQLGYSRGTALRRAVRAALEGAIDGHLREPTSFETGLDRFADEFSGDGPLRNGEI